MNFFVKLKNWIRVRYYTTVVSPKAQRAIQHFHNRHQGERCFIIGNGPSLRPEDLTILHERGDVTFAMNRIYNIFSQTPWRPTYYCCEDYLIIESKQKEISDIPCPDKFIPYELAFHSKVHIPGAHLFHINYDREQDGSWAVSEDCSKQINCRGTVTFTCMQLAIYMGFSQIYLLGIDHNYQTIIDINGKVVTDNSVKDYFCDNYDSDIKDIVAHDMGNNTRIYLDAKRYVDAHNIGIFNATRGGKLEVFPRVDFDLLMSHDSNICK